MRGILGKTLRSFATISFFGWWAGGLLFHIYTTWFAYQVSGFMSAAATFCFPVLAQIYWAYAVWDHYGFILNIFSVGLLAAFLVRVLTLALFAAAEAVDAGGG